MVYFCFKAQRLLSESGDVSEVVSGISNMSDSLCDAMAKLPVRFGEQKVSDLVNASIRSYINRDLASVQQETKGMCLKKKKEKKFQLLFSCFGHLSRFDSVCRSIEQCCLRCDLSECICISRQFTTSCGSQMDCRS